MISLARLAVGLLAVCSVSTAFAEEPPTKNYFSIGYYDNSMEFSSNADNGAFRVQLDNISLRYGYQLFNFLAIEGVFTTSEERLFPDDGTKVKNNYIIGAYARGQLQFPAYNTTLYGVAGLAHGKLTYTIEGNLLTGTTTDTITGNGISYGVGVELYGAPSTSFHFEIMQYLDTDYLTSQGIVLGITHHFAWPKMGTGR